MITVYSRGQQHGPYSSQDVQRFIQEGHFSPDDLGWKPGLPEWRHLRDFASTADVQKVSPGWAGHPAVPPKPKFDTGAIWALVFGILSLTFCLFGLTSIFAIVMGVNAKKRIKNDGTVRGEWLATTGIVLGAISGVILVLGVSLALILPSFTKQQSQTTHPVSASQGTQPGSEKVEEARRLVRTETGFPRGVELLESAAAQGNSEAKAYLGFIYMKGPNDIKNLVKAEQLLLEAASEGFNPAHMALGESYANGTFRGQPEPHKAIEHFRQAAKSGDKDAALNVGVVLLQIPNRTQQQTSEGLSILESEGKKNHPSALRFLGYIYAQGLVGPIDIPRSASYYRKAAELGDFESMHDMFLLAANWPSTVSPEEGAKWLNVAADKNFEPAINIRAQLEEKVRNSNIEQAYAQAEQDAINANPFYAAGRKLRDRMKAGNATTGDFAEAATVLGMALMAEEAKHAQQEAQWKPGVERSFYYDQSRGTLIYADRPVEVRDDGPVNFVRPPR